MTANGWLQILFYSALLLALTKPLGVYMVRVYDGSMRWLAPLERVVYRLCGIDPEEDQHWTRYAGGLLLFSVVSMLVTYVALRLQAHLPLNPAGLPAVPNRQAFETAASFTTNTNWQSYSGEVTMSYLSQMMQLAFHNFTSAASGMAAAVALARGIARRSGGRLGNFWTDLVRGTLYILLPLSFVLALVLVQQGVIQNFAKYVTVTTVEGAKQVLAMGPAASQIAIKQLGTNGGGFFNVNSAHPFENPTPLSNFLESLSILLISAALCYTFGKMVGDTRQGWALLAAMTLIFVVFLGVAVWAEQGGNPAFTALGIDQTQTEFNPGGNMEGKEARFGIANSALWATATTAASNGSVNSMHDSYMPLGGLVPLFMIQLGEIIFGGVGSGLYGMLAFVIVAVCISGLMLGRTPEYLGKKIEAFEMKMASLMLLIPILLVKVGTAVAVVAPAGLAGIWNTGGPHGFSEVLYAFSSAGNNNGSAFAGLSANTPFYNTALGLCMFLARYWLALPALAIAGSLARKKLVPVGPGTLPTHTPLFVVLLIGVVLLVGALTFIPALGLGPVVEHLTMIAA